LAGIKEFMDAGFDHVYIHQVGPKQHDFFRFYMDKILPRFDVNRRRDDAREGNQERAQ